MSPFQHWQMQTFGNVVDERGQLSEDFENGIEQADADEKWMNEQAEKADNNHWN